MDSGDLSASCGADAVTVYAPGSRPVREYAPRESVVASFVPLLPRIETVAPGTSAPDSSVTCPTTVAVCAARLTTEATNSNKPRTSRKMPHCARLLLRFPEKWAGAGPFKPIFRLPIYDYVGGAGGVDSGSSPKPKRRLHDNKITCRGCGVPRRDLGGARYGAGADIQG